MKISKKLDKLIEYQSRKGIKREGLDEVTSDIGWVINS